jgi:hypothetical protein
MEQALERLYQVGLANETRQSDGSVRVGGTVNLGVDGFDWTVDARVRHGEVQECTLIASLGGHFHATRQQLAGIVEVSPPRVPEDFEQSIGRATASAMAKVLAKLYEDGLAVETRQVDGSLTVYGIVNLGLWTGNNWTVHARARNGEVEDYTLTTPMGQALRAMRPTTGLMQTPPSALNPTQTVMLNPADFMSAQAGESMLYGSFDDYPSLESSVTYQPGVAAVANDPPRDHGFDGPAGPRAPMSTGNPPIHSTRPAPVDVPLPAIPDSLAQSLVPDRQADAGRVTQALADFRRQFANGATLRGRDRGDGVIEVQTGVWVASSIFPDQWTLDVRIRNRTVSSLTLTSPAGHTIHAPATGANDGSVNSSSNSNLAPGLPSVSSASFSAEQSQGSRKRDRSPESEDQTNSRKRESAITEDALRQPGPPQSQVGHGERDRRHMPPPAQSVSRRTGTPPFPPTIPPSVPESTTEQGTSPDQPRRYRNAGVRARVIEEAQAKLQRNPGAGLTQKWLRLTAHPGPPTRRMTKELRADIIKWASDQKFVALKSANPEHLTKALKFFLFIKDKGGDLSQDNLNLDNAAMAAFANGHTREIPHLLENAFGVRLTMTVTGRLRSRRSGYDGAQDSADQTSLPSNANVVRSAARNSARFEQLPTSSGSTNASATRPQQLPGFGRFQCTVGQNSSESPAHPHGGQHGQRSVNDALVDAHRQELLRLDSSVRGETYKGFRAFFLLLQQYGMTIHQFAALTAPEQRQAHANIKFHIGSIHPHVSEQMHKYVPGVTRDLEGAAPQSDWQRQN